MFSIFLFSTYKHCITSKVVPDKARLPLGAWPSSASWGSSGSVIKPSGRRFKNFKSKFADALFSLSAVLD